MWLRANMRSLRSAIPEPAYRRRSSAVSSSRSSPPRDPAREAVSGCRWPLASSSSPAVTCRPTASRAWAPRSGCICPAATRLGKRLLARPNAGRWLVAMRRCWLSRTTRHCARPRRRQLTELGYRVLEAGRCGGGAGDPGRRRPVDLLFTDVVMPGTMDGVDLAHAGHAVAAGPEGIADVGLSRRAVAPNSAWRVSVPSAQQAISPRRTGAERSARLLDRRNEQPSAAAAPPAARPGAPPGAPLAHPFWPGQSIQFMAANRLSLRSRYDNARAGIRR